MADVIRLKPFRRAKAAAERASKAERQRLIHGRDKAERAAIEHARRIEHERHAGMRLVPNEVPAGAPDEDE